MLKPEKNTHKLLISSTSRFTGEYEDEDMLVTHMWAVLDAARFSASISENPFCRNYFVIVFKTDPLEEDQKEEVAYPDYNHLGDFMCIYLSLLFGKRFDYHGMFETNGLFQLPNTSDIRPTQYPSMPLNNHHPRKDLEIPLRLSEVGRLKALFSDKTDPEMVARISAAGKFYLRSIRFFEVDPEIAFVDLVTCGEILSYFNEYAKEDLYDESLKEDLDAIDKHLEDGPEICKRIKSLSE